MLVESGGAVTSQQHSEQLIIVSQHFNTNIL